jgi:hypothetical protein
MIDGRLEEHPKSECRMESSLSVKSFCSGESVGPDVVEEISEVGVDVPSEKLVDEGGHFSVATLSDGLELVKDQQPTEEDVRVHLKI